MRYYFAPMEGITDSIYRRLHHQYFGGVDRYYMPFLSPTIHRTLTRKEDRELPMADSVPFTAIPQVLTKVPEDFLWAAQVCLDRGYTEVNLNVGCPSGTVTAKGKGAGMLVNPDGLDRFLETVFQASPLPISVKTRLGMADPAEFPALMEVFNRYPIRELIIHPRTRKQFYNGDLHMDQFVYAVQVSKNPLCFNGEIRSKDHLSAFSRTFPQIEAIMIGRGLVGDPGMLTSEGTQRSMLEAFHNALLEEYTVAFGSPRNAMSRLKENWGHLCNRFDGGERLFKQLRKTTDIHEYRATVAEIFATVPWVTQLPAK